MRSALIDGDPQRLGAYWLAGRLGAGGQGVVYEAYDQAGTRVAVKLLRGDLAGVTEVRGRMAKEVVAAQRVASFCTARVLGADLDGPRPYIVSEYVEGPSLRAAVMGGRRFTGDDLHRLATAIATALTAVHDAGVVHRDLKPDNVLLGPDGPRVIDFGVARTQEMSLTTTGVVAGTPGYMAPEVFSGERAGPAADVFAWGAVVLFAATGKDPFSGESLGAVMHRVLSHEPDLAVLPGSLRSLVRAALAKDGARRPRSRELLLGLLSADGLVGPAVGLLGNDGLTGQPDGFLRTDGLTGQPDGLLGTDGLTEQPDGFLRTDGLAGQADGLTEADGAVDTARLLARGASDGKRIGVAGGDPALGVIAEDAYAALSPADRELVPDIFLRLVTVTEDGTLVPREARMSELPPDADRALAAFAYLVSAVDGGERLRLLRPALPLAWPRLRAWIAANRDGLSIHRQILTAAERWKERGRKDADLLHGSSLDDALRWAAAERRNITLTPAERDFLEAGAALTRRRSRRTRALAAGLGVLLVVSLVAGGFAVRQSATLAEQGDTLVRQRDTAESARLAGVAESVRGRDPVLAMLLSAAAGRLSPTAEARSSLLASIADPATGAFHDPTTGPDVARALSADGRTLVSVSPGEVRMWDVATGRRTGGFTGSLTAPGRPAARLRQVAVSEDGRLLAVADTKGVALWSLATGTRVGSRVPASDEIDLEVSFNGGLLVIDYGQGKDIRDPRTGRTTMVPTLDKVAVHPGGDYAVGGGKRWALPSGKAQPGFPGICSNCAAWAAFSRDGQRLAIADDKGLTVFDARTRKEIAFIGDWDRMATPVFDRNGRLLAGLGTTLRLYDVDADDPLVYERELPDLASAVGFGPDGLRYLSEDAVVTLPPPAVSAEPVDEVELDPHGRWLASHALDAPEVRLAGSRTWAESRVRTAGRALAAGPSDPYDSELTFSRDGGRLALRRSDNVVVWDTATGGELARVPLAGITDGALPGPAGLWTAEEKTFTLWALPGGRRVKQVSRPRLFGWTANADGRLVGLDADRLRMVDLESGQPYGPRLPFPGATEEVWFGADMRLVAANFAGKVGIWDTLTGAQVGDWLRVGAPSWAAAFSADGGLFAFAAQDNTLTVWDVRRGQQVGPVVQLTDSARSVAFTDDAEVVAIGRKARLTRLPVAVGPLLKAVCARAGRTLTAAEWARHLPGRPYRAGC
ncbi:serine/threonine-protein kinase [Nonomuraea sp. NPDC005501]|uniref:WD40 repeat domain-containing serine/threonine protein kinase n=1 Tax=Nonomuraea sp. NPDC005501 TaxID=3156884 RepID=UPI0033A02741